MVETYNIRPIIFINWLAKKNIISKIMILRFQKISWLELMQLTSGEGLSTRPMYVDRVKELARVF